MNRHKKLEKVLKGSKKADELRNRINQSLLLIRSWLLKDVILLESIFSKKGVGRTTEDAGYFWNIFWHPQDIAPESLVLSFSHAGFLSGLISMSDSKVSVKLENLQVVDDHLGDLLDLVLEISTVARKEIEPLLELAK
jgi:hypothetical protein